VIAAKLEQLALLQNKKPSPNQRGLSLYDLRIPIALAGFTANRTFVPLKSKHYNTLDNGNLVS